MIAVPETIWSARSDTAKTACSRPNRPPAIIATTMPASQPPNVSAPQAPKKAPARIMPSSPMLTTPARSLITPPSAPKMSGVA